jgi:hypothetical protein
MPRRSSASVSRFSWYAVSKRSVRQFPAQTLLPFAHGIGFLRCFQAALNLCLNQLRLFENTNDFWPHELVQIILADRPIGANRTTQMTICIRANAAVIVKLLLGGLRRTPIERVAALPAYQHPLQ